MWPFRKKISEAEIEELLDHPWGSPVRRTWCLGSRDRSVLITYDPFTDTLQARQGTP